MGDGDDLRTNFEAILGEPLDPDLDPGEVQLRTATGTRLTERDRYVTSRDIGTTGDSSKSCARRNVLDVTGTARTGASGTIELELSDFYCPNLGQSDFTHPVNFVATPQSRSPRFVTALTNLIDGNRDVRIRVFAWDDSGQAAPNTSFHWRCKVPFEADPIVD